MWNVSDRPCLLHHPHPSPQLAKWAGLFSLDKREERVLDTNLRKNCVLKNVGPQNWFIILLLYSGVDLKYCHCCCLHHCGFWVHMLHHLFWSISVFEPDKLHSCWQSDFGAVVAFLSWTFWGSLSMCTHTRKCTSTGSVHRVRRLSVDRF